MHAQARLRREVVMAATDAARPRLAVAPGSPASFDDPNGWRKDALCRGVDTNLFFPAGELGEEPVLHAETAKAVCFRCPVREECLEYAAGHRPALRRVGRHHRGRAPVHPPPPSSPPRRLLETARSGPPSGVARGSVR